jgi:pyochelin synthetase
VTDVIDLVASLEGLGVQLWEDGGQLRFRAPAGVLTDERKARLRACKPELVEYLRDPAGAEPIATDPGAALDPFPLTDVQAAYLVGRDEAFDYGGVGCQVYLEAEMASLDPAALTGAWRHLIDRHPMLRAVVDRDGSQRILPEVPAYDVAVVDGHDGHGSVAAVREEMSHRSFEPDRWPLFDVRATRRTRDGEAAWTLHLSFDFLVADFMSIQLLLDELHQLLTEPSEPLPPIDVSFRDYVLAERRARQRRSHQVARDYWWRRIDELPPAPQLPLLDRPRTHGGPGRFTRWQDELGPGEWGRLRAAAGRYGLTPSGAVLAAYAEAIGRWTRQDRFTLDITLLNRLPVHPHVDRLVGDFTTVDLLEVVPDPRQPFARRAHDIQARLWEDMDHLSVSGVEVLRELGHRRGRGAALMPIVFTSAIALNDQGEEPRFWRDATLVHGLTQTPQVWIDCQVMVRGGCLAVNWDVRDGVFPPGLIDDLFGAFTALLHRLATDDTAWDRPADLPLPAAQLARRRAANDTDDPTLPRHRLLHDAIVERCHRAPDRPAVTGPAGTLSYGALLDRAGAVVGALTPHRVAGGLVAVVAEKGPDQIAAVLGTLLAGAAYLPIDVNQPPARRDHMLTAAGATVVLTDAARAAGETWPAGVTALAVDDLDPLPLGALPDARQGPGDLAYVIYTSGSTGDPKGVQITHAAALNTIEDVNTRFGVTADDRVLGLASLGFDLSVYDIFGLLAVGGCLVLPAADRRSDPSHWADLVATHGVTIWDTVPAQLQMLVDYLDSDPSADVSSLRLALLSGDWIPVTLPRRIRRHRPDLAVMSLGGATEASIWSIGYPVGEVPPDWRSIPYGRPLANQRFAVLDPWFRDAPDGVAGELHIAGAGLAAGYLGDPARTAERFVTHPRTGERLYRTGDLGRYRPDGTIEFLGREDTQVKIRGHRIELAEVEAAFLAQPGVGAAAALVDGDGPLDRRLVAFAEPARRPAGAAAGDAVARRVLAAAEPAGEAVMAGVDRDAYVDYLRRLDGVARLAMLDAFRRCRLFERPSDAHDLGEILDAMQAAPRHHRVVRRWLRTLCDHGMLVREAGTGRWTGARAVTRADIEDAWRDVDERQAALDPASSAVHDYFKASTANLAELLRGETAGAVQLLFPGGSLDVTDSLYNVTRFNRWANRIVAAAARAVAAGHAAGPLRVLEVGAGVGGTSKDVIPALDGFDVDYLFTDLSRFFLNRATETFAAYPWVRTATLDIDEDIRAQGFAPNSFDVVILGDVLHATRHVGRSLDNLRSLLAPGGWLLFAEMTRDHEQIMTSMELLLVDESAHGDFTDVRAGKDQDFVPHGEWLALLDRPGDDLVLHLPADSDPLAEIGLHVYASRVKTDRVPLTAARLLDGVRERLPAAMVPALVQVVDELPLTANAKVDRDRLATLVPAVAGSGPAGGDDAPADDLERRIAALWEEVLGTGSIGRGQGFFELGGDSLLASQLTRVVIERLPEAAELAFDVLLRRLLEGPTVAGVAASLREAP